MTHIQDICHSGDSYKVKKTNKQKYKEKEISVYCQEINYGPWY